MKVDWSALSHAYGPATDVPGHLAKIAAGKHHDVQALANKVAHQGWASCAAGIALVPELRKLAAKAKSAAARAACMRLLADLACLGDHRHYLGNGLDQKVYPAELPENAEFDALREAVTSRAAGALTWLGDRDAGVRSAAVLLVAVTRAPGGEKAIVARLKAEKTAVVRFDLLAALGWFAKPDLAPLRAALKSRQALERAGAAVSLARHGVLEDAVVAALVAGGSLTRSAFAGGDVGAHCYEVLLAACARAGREDVLRALVKGPDRDRRVNAGTELMRTMFAVEMEGHETKDRPASAVSAGQRSLLLLLAESDEGWDYGTDRGFMLRRLGLPKNPRAMRTFFGIADAPRPGDGTVVVDGKPTTFAEWILPRCTKVESGAAALGAEVAALAPAAGMIALFEDLRERRGLSGWMFDAVRLQALVAAGPAVVETLRERLRCAARDGPHSWLDEFGTRRIDPPGVIILFAALRRLSPGEKPPAGLKFDRDCVKYLAEHPESLGRQGAEWVAAAMKHG